MKLIKRLVFAAPYILSLAMLLPLVIVFGFQSRVVTAATKFMEWYEV